MAEIEAQALGRDQRALLLDMGAENPAQSGMEEMGGRMMGGGGAAGRLVHQRLDGIADPQGTRFHHPEMHMQTTQGLVRIVHPEAGTALSLQDAAISRLSPGFAIEWSPIEDHGTGLTGLQDGDFLPIAQDGQYLGAVLALPVTGEFRGRQAHGQVMIDAFSLDLATARPGGAGAAALLVHGRRKALHVQEQALFPGNIGGEIDGEAEGIGEFEDDGARNGCPRKQLGNGLFQQGEAFFQGFAETAFFLGQDPFHLGLRLRQFGVGMPHVRHQRRHQPVEKDLFQTQLAPMAHGAADDPAQHIAAPLVARQDAVTDEETAGANMVRQHPEAGVRRCIHAIVLVAKARGGVDERTEEVGVVIVVHALQDGGQALQTHAGIHGGLG